MRLHPSVSPAGRQIPQTAPACSPALSKCSTLQQAGPANLLGATAACSSSSSTSDGQHSHSSGTGIAIEQCVSGRCLCQIVSNSGSVQGVWPHDRPAQFAGGRVALKSLSGGSLGCRTAPLAIGRVPESSYGPRQAYIPPAPSHLSGLERCATLHFLIVRRPVWRLNADRSRFFSPIWWASRAFRNARGRKRPIPAATFRP